MGKILSRRKRAFLGAAAVGFAVATSAGAATIPFTDNFDADPLGTSPPTGFTAGGATTYSVVQQSGADNAAQAASSANSGSIGVSLTNVTDNALTLSTDARLTALTSGTSPAANFGFGLFGQSANFSANTEYRVLFTTIGTNGTIGIVRNGTNVTGTTSGQAVPIAVGTDYTLTVTATPQANGSLAFHATGTDGTKTTIFDYTDPTPLTGTFFGYRTATNGAGTTETVQYDNFSVTGTPVPEPAGLGLAALAGATALTRCRRRRRA
jgi:hypothetical protein